MEYLILGLVTAFNFIILKYKFDHARYYDLTIDIITLLFLSWLFKGTISGLIVAMIAGSVVSIYLLITTNRNTA
jgi:hypothetical protein